MPRHIDVYCNGVSLTDAVPIALLQQVTEDAATSEMETADRPGHFGQRLLGLHRKQLHVGIEFVLRELRDLTLRSHALEAAAAWAQDGKLELSNRPGRFLQCVCTQRPALGADRNYAQVLRADFTALAVPYWQDAQPVVASLTTADDYFYMRPTGTVSPLHVEATITPIGGTLEQFGLYRVLPSPGTYMILNGLSVPVGTPVRIAYDDRDVLTITAGGQGLLSHRNGHDDVTVLPEQNNRMHFTANVECSVVITARGLYL